jgi:ankyrin repeat protein
MTFAIDRNNAEICYELWKKGANINSVDSKYHTFLMTAVYNNMNHEMIEEILKNKPNINAIDKNLWTALTYAIRKENIDLVKLLLAYKATVYTNDLICAIDKENVEIINILCDIKVNISCRKSNIRFAKRYAKSKNIKIF